MCIAKLEQGYIIKFDKAFQIVDPNGQSFLLCKGQYYPIHDSENSENWLDDFYSSMDYINIQEEKCGWTWMSNIAEPVLLVHHCVGFAQVQQQLPPFVQDINASDYVQNIISWSNKLQRWKATHDSNSHVDMPCGPYYQCKRHKQMICHTCNHINNTYSSKIWNLKYNCNTKKSPHMWIFDKSNGLNMTMMQTVKKFDMK